MHIPVLIVGAGPTGLLMALLLNRYGIDFRIIDKDVKPVKTSNALATQIRTLEIWDDLNLLDKFLEKGNKINKMCVYSPKKKLANVTLNKANSPFPFILGISQHETETLLLETLTKQGVKVEMNYRLMDITENKTLNITLQNNHEALEALTCDWLIACDGSHSTIRKLLHIPFEGKELPQHFVMADFNLPKELSSHETCAYLSNKGPLFIINYDQGKTRLIAEVTKDKILGQANSLTLAQINRLLKERCPLTFTVDNILWTSAFWVHERIIPSFLHKNILFAGDAAHIHSPAGGQGMNTGLQDAYNLAWKLALVIKKKAHAHLLNTYHLERHQVVKEILTTTTFLTRMVSIRNSWLIFLRNKLLHFLSLKPKLIEKLVNNISQINIHYAKSPLSKNYLRQKTLPAGSLMIEKPINECHRELLNLLKGTNFQLLFFLKNKAQLDLCYELVIETKNLYPELMEYILITKDQVTWHNKKISDMDGKIFDHYGIKNDSIYLIRPDKYISYQGILSDKKSFLLFLKTFLI